MKENPNTLYRKNFNQTRCNTPTRKRISEVESRIAEWDKHHAGIAQSNFAKYGTGKLAPEGTVARLSGVPYPKLKNISSGDIKSFYYGYYDRGNTNIRILIETGSTSIPLLTDNITKVYQEINKTFGLKRKEMPYEELDEETAERLHKIINYCNSISDYGYYVNKFNNYGAHLGLTELKGENNIDNPHKPRI